MRDASRSDRFKIAFDQSRVGANESGSILGSVCFRVDGVGFPADDWEDFVVVLAGWWLAAVDELSAGKRDTWFLFMDGPFWVNATLDERGVHLADAENRFELTIGLSHLQAEILRFAREVVAATDVKQGRSPDSERLRELLQNRSS